MSERMATVRVDEINEHDVVYFSHLRTRDPWDMINRGVVSRQGARSATATRFMTLTW